jgi:hypothetical protein
MSNKKSIHYDVPMQFVDMAELEVKSRTIGHLGASQVFKKAYKTKKHSL